MAVVANRYKHRLREQLLAIKGRHVRAPARLAAYAVLLERTFVEDWRLCVCGMLGAEADSLPAEVTSEVAHFVAFNLYWL